MDHAQRLSGPSPWRTATLVTAAFALLELALLIAGGTALLARPFHHSAATTPAAQHAAATAVRHVVHVPKRAAVPSVPLRARSRVAVLVLNGNGVQGAASAEASHLQTLGYRIGGATNALRHDYARSMVMYAPGYGKEARRLAHDTGVRMVAPADGATPATLKASPLVLLLGS
ncbi:MAG TPA: LytR C-terminal domain-containing protein [Gaiellaceae bacterium]